MQMDAERDRERETGTVWFRQTMSPPERHKQHLANTDRHRRTQTDTAWRRHIWVELYTDRHGQ
eukprot:9200563-Lingulodinium_polyedra.AAC.1